MRLPVLVSVAAFFLVLGGCSGARSPANDREATDGSDEPIVGGPCDYATTPGMARIVSVEAAPAGEANCPQSPVKVIFDFTPADMTQSSKAIAGLALNIGDGKNPPEPWVTASGLSVGSEHPADRMDEIRGTCSPLVVELKDVDYAAANVACYSPPDDEDLCAKAGGTVVSASCCTSASKYPNTCLVGACGCSPEGSAPLDVCECPGDECFDGTKCVAWSLRR